MKEPFLLLPYFRVLQQKIHDPVCFLISQLKTQIRFQQQQRNTEYTNWALKGHDLF